MQENTLPEFDEVTAILDQTEMKLHVSQVHGMVAGIISGDYEEENWREAIMGEPLVDEVNKVLQRLHDATTKQFIEFLFELEMLLPGEDYSLTERAEALTVWCQGYLSGLQLAGVSIDKMPDAEATEAANDLIEIAKMNYEQVVASEEDEDAYIELVEFVRMAVILIYQSLHEDLPLMQGPGGNQLH